MGHLVLIGAAINRSHPDEKIAETIQLSRLGKHRGAVFAQTVDFHSEVSRIGA
jgi:hypothetical protein